jgi:hypothetical protein
MSNGILYDIPIGSGQTQGWVLTWTSPGWHGDTIVQPQPLDMDALMSYTDPAVSLNRDGTYSFAFSVTNKGPNPTYYNLQLGVD